MYALMTVHTGEVKTKANKSQQINKVKDGELLTFKTKKEARSYIDSKLAWALTPVKVYKSINRWKGEMTFYRFDN